MPNKASRPKVLHIIPSLALCRGGPSKAAIEMVSSLCDSGLDAQIATTNDNGATELDVALNTLINYHGAPTRFFNRFSPPINAVREFSYSGDLRRWLAKHIGDYDIIHVHAIFSFSSSYAMFLARKKKIPYVVRPIGQLQHWSLKQSTIRKERYLDIIERANIEAASAVQFTADSERQEASERFQLRAKVIPLGVDLPEKVKISKADLIKSLGLENTKITILYLSRLHEKKGLELLMQALARFEKIDFSLLIAGDGERDYKDSLEQLSEQLNLTNKCHFLGQVAGDKKLALLQHSDLFALTSYSENFGISVLEAMACGLVPLISDQVALSTVIQDHQLGLVCSVDVDSIESQLNFAFSNQEASKAMGLKAQRYAATHYSWPNIATQLESLYTSLIEAKPQK